MLGTIWIGWSAFVMVCCLVDSKNAQRTEQKQYDTNYADRRIKKEMDEIGIEFTSKETGEFSNADAEGKDKIYEEVLDTYEPDTKLLDEKLTILRKARVDLEAAQEYHNIHDFLGMIIDTDKVKADCKIASKMFNRVKVPDGDQIAKEIENNKWAYSAFMPGGPQYEERRNEYNYKCNHIRESIEKVKERISELASIREAEHRRT